LIYTLQLSEDTLFDVLEILEWYDGISSKLSSKFKDDLNNQIKLSFTKSTEFSSKIFKQIKDNSST
jgi:hypothetical protein